MGSWKQIGGYIENVLQYLWWLCWCQLIGALRHCCACILSCGWVTAIHEVLSHSHDELIAERWHITSL